MKKKTQTPWSLPLCMLAIMLVFIAFALQMAGCGDSGSNGTAAQGGWSSETSSTSTGPKVDSAVNMDNPGQSLGTGDWLQINGSGFGSSQGTSYVSFSNGSDINVKADSYFLWSDTQVVCRVPVNLKGKAVAGLPNNGICAGTAKNSIFRELADVLLSSPELLAGGAGSGFKPTPMPAVTIPPVSRSSVTGNGRKVANLGGPMLLPMLVVGGVAAAIVNATVNSNQHNADPQPTPPLLSPSPSPSPSTSPSPSPSPSASPSASPTPSPAYSPTPGGGGGGGGSTTQWWSLGAASSAGAYASAAPQIKINSAGVPCVAFGNGDDGDSNLHVGTFSSSTGWNEMPLPTPAPSPSDTPTPATGYNPALYVDGTVPYVAYYSKTTGFLNIYRYNTGSGNWAIVVTEASALTLKNMSLYANGSSTATPSIYVAYQATDGTVNTYVRQVSGTSLDNLGTWNDAQNPSLHGDGSTPYIAYEDTQTPQVVVKYYGESIKSRYGAKSSQERFPSWQSCGTIATVTSPKLYVSNESGTAIPYCAYFDADKKTHVSKYESSAWAELGSGMIVSGATRNLDHALAVDAGIPYVALIGNSGSNYAVAVKKFTGGSWADVGSPAISASTTSVAKIGIDVSSGIPEVAYVDQSNSYVTVQKYATSKALAYLNSRLFQKNLPCGVPSALLP